ncbi:hypothetical protein C2S51_002984 [Perilla frutescens var. frutescens]|nr:hypothetical protein C2S51_002984 [Perilla frutescens var. frutescens]
MERRNLAFKEKIKNFNREIEECNNSEEDLEAFLKIHKSEDLSMGAFIKLKELKKFTVCKIIDDDNCNKRRFQLIREFLLILQNSECMSKANMLEKELLKNLIKCDNLVQINNVLEMNEVNESIFRILESEDEIRILEDARILELELDADEYGDEGL